MGSRSKGNKGEEHAIVEVKFRMVKIIDGEKELLAIPRDDVTYSCVVFAVVSMLVTLLLVGGYKIFFPTALEANTDLGQTWGVIMLIAIVIMTIVIDAIVGLLIKEKDLIIRREDVSGKKVVLVRAISFTREVRNRAYSVYIPGYHRKSFKIVSMTMPELRNALERLGATVELAGSWPGINPRGET